MTKYNKNGSILQCDAEMSNSIELAILHWKVFDAMKEKPLNNNEMLN